MTGRRTSRADARRQRGQRAEVAAEDRQVLDLLVRDRRGQTGALRIDDRRGGGDGDRLADARCQLDVGLGRVAEQDGQLRQGGLAEAGQLRIDLVTSRREQIERVGAVVLRDGSVQAGVDIRGGHGDARQAGAGAVGDLSADRAGRELTDCANADGETRTASPRKTAGRLFINSPEDLDDFWTDETA